MTHLNKKENGNLSMKSPLKPHCSIRNRTINKQNRLLNLVCQTNLKLQPSEIMLSIYNDSIFPTQILHGQNVFLIKPRNNSQYSPGKLGFRPEKIPTDVMEVPLGVSSFSDVFSNVLASLKKNPQSFPRQDHKHLEKKEETHRFTLNKKSEV